MRDIHQDPSLTVTSHMSVLRLKPPTFRLFTQKFVSPNNKEHTTLHYWPLVREIHRSPVDSPHKGPVMRKACPCHDVIMPTHSCHMIPTCHARNRAKCICLAPIQWGRLMVTCTRYFVADLVHLPAESLLYMLPASEPISLKRISSRFKLDGKL